MPNNHYFTYTITDLINIETCFSNLGVLLVVPKQKEVKKSEGCMINACIPNKTYKSYGQVISILFLWF